MCRRCPRSRERLMMVWACALRVLLCSCVSVFSAKFAKNRKGREELLSLSLRNRKRPLSYFEKRAQTGRDVFAKMQTDRAAMAARQRLKIAQRLGLFQYPEREGLIRQRNVHSVVGGHLDEHTARRSALVKLTGGMQEPGPVAGGGRDVKRISKMPPNRFNQLLVLGRLLNVIKHRYVVAGMRATQMSGYELLERKPRPKLIDGFGVAIGDQSAALCAKLLFREGTVLLILFEQSFGVVFALLHVGLIESVDSEDHSGNSGSHFPEVKLLAEVEQIVKPPPHHRVPGCLKRAQPGFRFRIGRPHRYMNKKADVAIDRGRTQLFTCDGDYAFAFFAGALGNQLFNPQSKR